VSTGEGPRIEPLEPADARRAAADANVIEAVADLNIFRVLLRHPQLAKGVERLLGQLLFRGSLDARLRELVIMRIGWLTGSVYEWIQHWRVATQLGVEPDDLLGVRDWERYDGFGDAERAVLAATDETVRDGRVSDATWGACTDALADDQALLELVAVIGCWRMIASVLQTLQIPLEDGVEPWPPDGVSPG
jgi:alkylhydroperoxidase family enzyme